MSVSIDKIMIRCLRRGSVHHTIDEADENFIEIFESPKALSEESQWFRLFSSSAWKDLNFANSEHNNKPAASRIYFNEV